MSDLECSEGSYCHAPSRGPAHSRCISCRRRKRPCHRDGMCCPGNRCSNSKLAYTMKEVVVVAALPSFCPSVSVCPQISVFPKWTLSCLRASQTRMEGRVLCLRGKDGGREGERTAKLPLSMVRNLASLYESRLTQTEHTHLMECFLCSRSGRGSLPALRRLFGRSVLRPSLLDSHLQAGAAGGTGLHAAPQEGKPRPGAVPALPLRRGTRLPHAAGPRRPAFVLIVAFVVAVGGGHEFQVCVVLISPGVSSRVHVVLVFFFLVVVGGKDEATCVPEKMRREGRMEGKTERPREERRRVRERWKQVQVPPFANDRERKGASGE